MPGGRQAGRGVNSLYMRERSPTHAEEDPLPEPTTRRARSGRRRGRSGTRVQPAPTQSVDEDDQAVGLHTGGGGTSSDSLDHEEATAEGFHFHCLWLYLVWSLLARALAAPGAADPTSPAPGDSTQGHK
jgi:hypothetical protein